MFYRPDNIHRHTNQNYFLPLVSTSPSHFLRTRAKRSCSMNRLRDVAVCHAACTCSCMCSSYVFWCDAHLTVASLQVLSERSAVDSRAEVSSRPSHHALSAGPLECCGMWRETGGGVPSLTTKPPILLSQTLSASGNFHPLLLLLLRTDGKVTLISPQARLLFSSSWQFSSFR